MVNPTDTIFVTESPKPIQFGEVLELQVETFRTINYSAADDVLQLEIPGKDFVMEQAQDLVDLVFDEFDDGPKDLVLDLTSISYINSSGISVIIRMNLEKNLRLVNPSATVTDILELTGVLPFVPKFGTVDEAVDSF